MLTFIEAKAGGVHIQDQPGLHIDFLSKKENYKRNFFIQYKKNQYKVA
jgi:hypothetical protein